MRSRTNAVLKIVAKIQRFHFVFVFVFAKFSITDAAKEVSADAVFFVALSTSIFGSIGHIGRCNKNIIKFIFTHLKETKKNSIFILSSITKG